MILSVEKYCVPASMFEYSGSQPVLFGERGLLGIALLSSGQGSLPVNGQTTLVQAGSLVLTAEAITFSPSLSSHLVGVLLRGAAAAEAAASLKEPLVIGAQTCPAAPELLYQLLAGINSRERNADEHSTAAATILPPERASALAYTLLCQLAGASFMQTSIPPLIAAAMAEIQEHYAEVYGVAELASGLGVSKSHLVRSFTAAVGLPPGRHLTAVRLGAAKRLLLHREYTLDTIASLCGFASANYFCRVFKKETGQTPATWRAKTAPHAVPQPVVNEWEEQLFL